MAESSLSARPEVAIAGCGAVSAVGCGVEALRSALRANASGLRRCERFDSPRFQSAVVGAATSMRDGGALAESIPPGPGSGSPAEAGTPYGDGADDPAWRLADTALREARESARDALRALRPARLGLVLSTTKANIEALERLTDGRACSEAARRHLQPDLLAADLAEAHGAAGPVQCVSVACVSGLIALQQGARLIQRGAADAVLVAGVDHLSDFVMAGFSALKAIDPAGCRPFDRDRRGLSPGEAGAAIVLARTGLAPRGAIRLRGWGASNDAHHMTGPARDGSGLARAIRGALEMSGRPAIDYINAHGTGTLYNDAMEFAALRAVFADRCPPVSGAKGMLGHTLGAAGILETILSALALRERWLPGTPRLTTPAEDAPASLVSDPRPAARLDHVLKLGAGFGGTNAALVLAHE